MTVPSVVHTATGLRVAWFSPMPPSRSGIAAYSDELLPLLRARGVDIDVYAEPPRGTPPGGLTARDFVWTARRRPYDLTVYQLGNAACHDYMWGYLFRYPGLVVLHDAQVHQARAQGLLNRYRPRRDDYLAEFAASHPAAPPDLGPARGRGARRQPVRALAAHPAGAAGGSPHRGPQRRPRRAVAGRLRRPRWRRCRWVSPIRWPPCAPPPPAALRRRYALPDDALIVAAFGGVTPEKRLPELIEAMAALTAEHPRLHLLVVGAPWRTTTSWPTPPRAASPNGCG